MTRNFQNHLFSPFLMSESNAQESDFSEELIDFT